MLKRVIELFLSYCLKIMKGKAPTEFFTIGKLAMHPHSRSLIVKEYIGSNC